MIEYVDDNKYESKVADIRLAADGRVEIEKVESAMRAIVALRNQSKTLDGVRVVCSSSVTAEMAVLVETMVSMGAQVRWCADDPTTTQDMIASAVSEKGVSVFAWKGESWAEYWWCMLKAFDFGEDQYPDVVIDNGGRVLQAMNVGKESERNPSILDMDNSDKGEDYCELIEMLFMTRGRDYWHAVSDNIKRKYIEVEKRLEPMKNEFGLNIVKL